MNVSFYTSQVTQIEPLSIPGILWTCYLEYLWFYEPDSWVATIAYSFRVFAFLVALPFVILGLLVRMISALFLFLLLRFLYPVFLPCYAYA